MQKTNKMVIFKEGNIIFYERSGGVCLRNDEVLLFFFPSFNGWSLPGGRCNLLETSKEAVKREYLEEIGEEVTVKDNIIIAENMFTEGGKDFHEILFVYLVEFEKDSNKYKVDEFYATEGEEKMLCKWFKLNELKDINLKPEFLKTELSQISKHTKHIVYRDN
ncbi:MAG: NUDIX domain-containing protein [bacterium]